MAKSADTPRETPLKCRKCKREEWKFPVVGRPPGEAWASCPHCGHRWGVCGSHPDSVSGPCMLEPVEGYKRCHRHGAHAGPKGEWGNELEKRFVSEFLVDLDGEAAVKRAGFRKGNPGGRARRLLADRRVRSQIERAMADRAERVQRTADDVIQQLWDVAFADASELCQYRRECCRFCWGGGNRYQFTQEEMRSGKAAHAARAAKSEDPLEPFDEAGGIGYNPNQAPNLDCPECFGKGSGTVYFADTRTLSPEVKSLFAGVKVTKDGVEIKVASQERARELLMKHLGLLTEKVEVDDVTGLSDSERVARTAAIYERARQARAGSAVGGE